MTMSELVTSIAKLASLQLSTRLLKSIFGLAIVASLVGCMSTSGVRVEDSSRSIGEIRAAIKSISGEPREIRSYQREFVSKYYSRKFGDADFDPVRSKERLYARFRILGDRRPYDIEIVVFVENRIGGRYELVGEDEEWAERLAVMLREELTRSREDLNVVDDFKPF